MVNSDTSNREIVVEILGEPDLTGGDVKLPSIGYAPWIKYLRSEPASIRPKKLRLVSLNQTGNQASSAE